MIRAYASLFHLILHDPSRIGWLAAHAWRWHKGPLATLAVSIAAVWWATTEIIRRMREGRN